MSKLAKVTSRLKALQADLKGVSTATAMRELALFLDHDLDEMIRDLEEVESDLATD